MREAVMKEAKLFTNEEDCYIHVERGGEGSSYAVVLAGGPATMLQGVYNILSRMEQLSGIPMKDLIRMLEQGRKKSGTHKPFRVIEDEDDT